MYFSEKEKAVFGKLIKNVGDAGFSRKRGGNAGSGPPHSIPWQKRGEVWRHVTMDFFGSTISGWQQNQWQRRRKENGRKVIGFYWQNNKFDVHHAILFILPSLQPCDMKIPNFTGSLHLRWTQHKSCLFLFLHLNTVLSDSTWENFAKWSLKHCEFTF